MTTDEVPDDWGDDATWEWTDDTIDEWTDDRIGEWTNDATERGSGDVSGGWTGEASDVSQLRGTAFRYLSLFATAFGIVSVFVLLLFVANDALRPFTADTGWLLVYAATVLVPTGALALHYYLLDEPAGEVASITAGLPVLGGLVAGGFLVLFLELLTVREWFALVTASAVAVCLIAVHARLRPTAALERLAVMIIGPVSAVLGLPPAELLWLVNSFAGGLNLPVRLSTRILSFRELFLTLPVRPVDWILLVLTLAVPVGAAAGWVVAKRRGARRDGYLTVGLVAVGATVGALAGPALGVESESMVILVTFLPVPLGVYVEGVLRRGAGTRGLALPVVLVLGLLAGALLVRTFGFAGPDSWLDWSFLTSAHSRTPEKAGIYPTMVGSVMMLVVIILTTFPVGVGAAIYLEEYAPSSGWAGRLVTLVEINIGNLAGVPSVVYGLLGLALFIRIVEWPQGTVIVGGLAVGLLILPIVIISSQEAIRSVPDSHRRASYGMGATRWQTTRNVVLPRALPGILTGTILALGRAIGETAPLLMIGAAASIRLAPGGFFDLFSAMPRQIFSWASELDPAFRHGVLAAGVVTLVAVMLVMNATAIIVRNKYQRKHQ